MAKWYYNKIDKNTGVTESIVGIIILLSLILTWGCGECGNNTADTNVVEQLEMMEREVQRLRNRAAERQEQARRTAEQEQERQRLAAEEQERLKQEQQEQARFAEEQEQEQQRIREAVEAESERERQEQARLAAERAERARREAEAERKRKEEEAYRHRQLVELAEQGFPEAQFALGFYYGNTRNDDNSTNVDHDNQKAFRWFRKAAKQGFKPALEILGMGTSGETPLHIWVIDGDVKTLENLIRQGADVNAKDNLYGAPLLLWVAMMRCEQSCRLLLDAGANVNAYASEDDKRTAFHQAIWDWHKGICEMLLEAGADINALDADDETPLHWAAKHSPVEALEFLLQRGARTDMKDNQGKLPIDVANTEEKRTILRNAMK